MDKGVLIWVTGLAGSGKTTISKRLCKELRKKHENIIHLDGDTLRDILGNNYGHEIKDRLLTARIYSRLCNNLVKQGMIVIISTISLFHEIHDYNAKNNEKYFEILINVEKETLLKRNQKNLYSDNSERVMGIHQKPELPKNPALILENNELADIEENIKKILSLLKEEIK